VILRNPIIYELRLELALAICRLRSLCATHRRPAVSALGRGRPEAAQAHTGLLADNGYRPRRCGCKAGSTPRGTQRTFTFEWTRDAVEAHSWRYEVATEPPGVELENFRFLSGHRRVWLFSPHLLAQFRERNLDGASLDDAFNCLLTEPSQHVRSAVLQLLWRQESDDRLKQATEWTN
jgi:hypothetical protein